MNGGGDPLRGPVMDSSDQQRLVRCIDCNGHPNSLSVSQKYRKFVAKDLFRNILLNRLCNTFQTV
jgi:hypothetical protein